MIKTLTDRYRIFEKNNQYSDIIDMDSDIFSIFLGPLTVLKAKKGYEIKTNLLPNVKAYEPRFSTRILFSSIILVPIIIRILFSKIFLNELSALAIVGIIILLNFLFRFYWSKRCNKIFREQIVVDKIEVKKYKIKYKTNIEWTRILIMMFIYLFIIMLEVSFVFLVIITGSLLSIIGVAMITPLLLFLNIYLSLPSPNQESMYEITFEQVG